MGRAFEFRKERKFKRWAKMSVQFTRIGKEIAMSVRENGPYPESNSRLRSIIQNAKSVNMPKDRIDAAIKRASDKSSQGYEEHIYEGYGPHGVAILIETATDNINRTVANIRSYFAKGNGSLGKTGSLDFIFQRKSIFRFLADENLDTEQLELELIDGGLEELYFEKDDNDDDLIVIQASFEDFGKMQKLLEEMNIDVKSATLERITLSTSNISEEDAIEVLKLIDKIEEDDDVQAVYHNMA